MFATKQPEPVEVRVLEAYLDSGILRPEEAYQVLYVRIRPSEDEQSVSVVYGTFGYGDLGSTCLHRVVDYRNQDARMGHRKWIVSDRAEVGLYYDGVAGIYDAREGIFGLLRREQHQGLLYEWVDGVVLPVVREEVRGGIFR